ncbi:MAG TPA: DUF1800 domain-containing protein [Candidatus Acidoferrales bacterium]|nr:DUF1800 domain-containing protein [Candidatus Acidoferrales bacterium]
MGTPQKQAARAAAPTRRKVLITALAAGAGVASARVLGLRNLNTPSAVDAIDAMTAADPMGMYGATDAADAQMDLPDDSFFGPQDLDGSVLPEQLRPAATLPPVAPPKTTVAALQPPISGIAMPRLAGDLDWVSPLAAESAKITHLLRRTTFSYTEAELDRALSDGYARTVDRLLETPFAEPPAFGLRPAATPTPSPRASASASASARPSASASVMPSPSASPSASPRPSAAPTGVMPTPTPSLQPLTINSQINIGNLQIWWYDWMTASPTPFAEKMTLYWHGHFTSDYRKVGTNSPAIYWQNLTWRRMGLGDLKSMLLKVTPDLAMLHYLDLAASTASKPNENYARELMEVFALGVGNYTEDDVRAAAKALAGWRLPMRTETTAMAGVFDPKRAFAGAVTFLGRTGSFTTEQVVDQILAQDATATFITRRLASAFVSPGATDAYVARLAGNFRRNAYDVKSLMREMLTSPEFTAPDAYRTLIKSPVEFMVSSAKALGATNLSRTMNAYAVNLGQNIFDPPSVAGWGDNASWISSNTMLQRANYVSTILGQLRQVPSAAKAHDRHLDGVLGPGTVQELNNARDDRSRWFAVFASPEFQLK